MEKNAEKIMRLRANGLYLSRRCGSLKRLASELMGLHCWFHRNVAFSAAIRGADTRGWKTALTKTWLYRGTLHGANYEELPLLLAPHADEMPWAWIGLSLPELEDAAERVVRLMEDGVYSRREMREIFAADYDPEVVARMFSPWGGIFVYLARHGRVAFRDMTSRDFDLIDAEPTLTREEALPILLHRYFQAYGPATIADAAWFFGIDKETARRLSDFLSEDLSRLEFEGHTYYYVEPEEPLNDIPALTLLSGFDPYLVSYAERGLVLPAEYKAATILKSGICLPTVAIDGRVAGLWNIKKSKPTVEFFEPQSAETQNAALSLVDELQWRLGMGM